MSSLLERIRQTTDRASLDGALVSLPTERVTIEDRGIPFIVHITTLQEHKQRTRPKHTGRPVNPFLPPDPELFIADLTDRHIGVLNKFNVIDNHLLIVTKTFEPQETLLDVGDFEALTLCMTEIDGLGFYNGGVVAGASQPHKHLQVVPLPLAENTYPTPIDAVIDRPTPAPGFSSVPGFGFVHVLAGLGDGPMGPDRSEELFQLYLRACTAVGVHDESQPYNLLLTRRWMLIVPRSREHWGKVSINALGFAGSLLVRNHHELDRLKTDGPSSALESVVGPGLIP